jgi:hypothetical protein
VTIAPVTTAKPVTTTAKPAATTAGARGGVRGCHHERQRLPGPTPEPRR